MDCLSLLGFIWGDIREKLAKIQKKLLELIINIQSCNRYISVSRIKAKYMSFILILKKGGGKSYLTLVRPS